MMIGEKPPKTNLKYFRLGFEVTCIQLVDQTQHIIERGVEEFC